MKNLIYFLSIFFILNAFSQEKIFKYNVYLFDSSLAPEFKSQNNEFVYSGKNEGLKIFFDKYKIKKFNKAFTCMDDWEEFSRILYLETTDATLADDLLSNYPNIYRKFEDITDRIFKLTYYPNDYGTTSPNPNLGAVIERSDLDYMNVQKAWDIPRTPGVKIGISDARINNTNLDFASNTSFINGSYYQNQPYDPNNMETFHGTATAGIAAAKGNNGYGSTGVCYDCNIVGTQYSNFNNLLLLAQSGVRVINMSWAYMSSSPNAFSEMEQLTVNTLVNYYNVVLVAAAGNQSSYQTSTDFTCGNGYFTGIRYGFPASYDGVISVSSVAHNFAYTLPLSTLQPSYCCTSPTGKAMYFLRGGFSSVDGTNPNNPISAIFNGYPEYCDDGSISSPNGINARATTNPLVDILAPTINTFRFDIFSEQNNLVVYTHGATSGSAPRVSGTAALMIGANSCLIPKEVDNIIKLTSIDVEHTTLNQDFQGQIGAGAINAGDAVEFVNEMKKSNGNAIIRNHIFNRFDFKLVNINNKLTIENATFNQDCKVNFKAKNQIHLLPGTALAPNVIGDINLSIDSNIVINCNPIFFARNANEKNTSEVKSKKSEIVLFPNPNNGYFEIYNIDAIDFNNEIIQLSIFDLNGRELFKKDLNNNDVSNLKIEMQHLKTGVYILKLFSSNYAKEIKFLKN